MSALLHDRQVTDQPPLALRAVMARYVLAAAVLGAGLVTAVSLAAPEQPRTTVVATGLEAPWELVFLPDRRALLTERPGRVVLFSAGFRSRRLVATVEVDTGGRKEGGLLGITLDPDFRRNRLVYLYRTAKSDENQVLRYRLTGNRLVLQRKIFGGLEASDSHNGGRLKFGPDRALWITTGEAYHKEFAQDPSSLNGKILRLPLAKARGAGGRPEIVSAGHRNVQGIDWQPGSGRLFITELGEENRDEVNIIRRGGNYGWPEVAGRDDGGGRFVPAAWDTGSGNIAPSGATFVHRRGSAWTGSFVFGTLRGEHVVRLKVSGARVLGAERLFEDGFGRIRNVVEGPDGALYLLTSNRDGRGDPSRQDDRIIRLVPPRR
jgi:glucose/arabinose dehydrogenase